MEAESINQCGESQLRGENVDAMGKAGLYAETQLPNTITQKVPMRPHVCLATPLNAGEG
jgi:hypothetical protein